MKCLTTVVSLLSLACICSFTSADSSFRIGIECPSQLTVEPNLKSALSALGINYINYYPYTSPGNDPDPAAVNIEMIKLANELGIDYSIACHAYDPPEECIRKAVESSKEGSRFLGIVADELEHIRLLQHSQMGQTTKPLADISKFQTLDQAYDMTLQGFRDELALLKSQGAPAVTSTHIWPVMNHISARAGYTVCPKICKELYSPVSLAIGMGAALEYGRDLWADIDLWYWDMIPGHSPEEFRSNLLYAYWMGVDVVYVEGCGFNLFPAGKQGSPFSLINRIDTDKFQFTQHGEVLRWFCKEYLPAHPRKWTFRDVKPSIAIVRFEDTCHGQRSSLPDELYGSKNLHSDADTEAWLGIWNLLTFGRTNIDGLTHFKHTTITIVPEHDTKEFWVHNYASRPLQADTHRFFTPMNGAVVYDHVVDYEHLKDVPLIFLTGKKVSAHTIAAIRKCVQDGAVCVAWGPLAKKNGFADWESGVKVVPEGKGRFVITDNFQYTQVFGEIAGLVGQSDKIRYRFGNTEVTFRRVTDNDIDVELKEIN